MSVYTKVSTSELRNYLRQYRVGALREFVGIADGIENSNYFVTTEDGRFVLTLFEQASVAGLRYCLSLMAYLAEHAVPCAHPIPDDSGDFLRTLNGKPAALVERLDGVSVADPSIEHCRAIGISLGALHSSAQSYQGHRENERGLTWHTNTAGRVRNHLPLPEQRLLDAELEFLRCFDFGRCSQGVIHADLFRDNALFEGPVLAGLIDFYYAYNGPLIYDLAVTVSDWCFSSDGVLDIGRARTLVNAYASKRAITDAEKSAWIPCLRAAGLRFWLSRLHDRQFRRQGELTHVKDPNPFRAILESCRDRGDHLLSVWG